MASEVVQALDGTALAGAPEICRKVRRAPTEPVSVPGLGGPPRTVPGKSGAEGGAVESCCA